MFYTVYNERNLLFIEPLIFNIFGLKTNTRFKLTSGLPSLSQNGLNLLSTISFSFFVNDSNTVRYVTFY